MTLSADDRTIFTVSCVGKFLHLFCVQRSGHHTRVILLSLKWQDGH